MTDITSKEVLNAIDVIKKLVDERRIAFQDRVGDTFEVTYVSVFQEGITFSGWKVGDK